MPILFQTTTVRPAQSISRAKSSDLAFFTHESQMRSERLVQWCELAKNRQDKLILELKKFINSDAIIKETINLPESLHELIDFSESRDYEFSFEEFYRYAAIVFEKERNSHAGDDSHVRLSRKPLFSDTKMLLEDQLLAESIVGATSDVIIDTQNLLKTINLLERLFRENVNIEIKIRLDKFYDRPIVIDSCLSGVGFCQELDNDELGFDHSNIPRSSSDDTEECECLPNDDCVDHTLCRVKITPYIGELFEVRDRVSCYEPADISDIENVIQSEIRTKEHRQLTRKEIYTENEVEERSFEERDHQVDQQNAIHNEVDKVIDNELGMDVGASYTYGKKASPMSFTASTSLNVKQSRHDARKRVQDKTKNIVNKAVSRLEKKSRKLRSTKVINETEVKNKHVFGGAEGAPKDISRQFYYVNQVRKAQIYSRGYRAMIDLYIPEPSEMYKYLLKLKFDLKKPESPKFEEVDCSTIDNKNYKKILNLYGITEKPTPPKWTTTVTVELSGTPGDPRGNKKSGSHLFHFPCLIPPDYEAIKMKATIVRQEYNKGGGQSISASLGTNGENVWDNDHTDLRKLNSSLSNVTGDNTVTVHAWDATYFDWDLIIIAVNHLLRRCDYKRLRRSIEN